MTVHCKICQGETSLFYTTQVLQKYSADYYTCNHCGFIQTSEPVWLKEAYNSAITNLDIGLIDRNLYLREHIPKIIDNCFPKAKIMIDYGGGYGLFVRLMRDMGYNFFRQDIYCENIFSNYFDVSDTNYKSFDLLTAFEVFEHFNHPMGEIEKMFQYSEHIIFTTQLIPDKLEDFKNWWYVSPLTGQHIAFYSLKSLEFIAKKFNKNLYSNGSNLHIFTTQKTEPTLVKTLFQPKKKSLIKRIKLKLIGTNNSITQRPSLLQSDYKFIEEKLIGKN